MQRDATALVVSLLKAGQNKSLFLERELNEDEGEDKKPRPLIHGQPL